jgi:sugar lactone lactonase YvrE
VRLAGLALVSLLLAACSASAAERPTLRLTGARTAVAGAAWTGTLVVSPATAGRPALTARAGSARRNAAVTRAAAGRWRARLVLPTAGRWSLTGRLGGRSVALGALTVRAAAPLALSGPEHAVIAPDGRLLVAEQGADRIVAVDTTTGAVTVLAQATDPFGLARAPSGDLYASSHGELLRADASGRVTTVHRAAGDIGPVAVGAGGEVYFVTSEDRLYRLEAGGGTVTHLAGNGTRGSGGDGGPALAAQLAHPHGLAVAADGTFFLADTESGRVRRIDGRTGIASTLATGLSEPWAVALAPDGSVVVTERLGGRVWRVDAAGRAAPVTAAGALDSPVGIAVDPSGAIFVTELETGHVRRIAADGTITTLRGS